MKRGLLALLVLSIGVFIHQVKPLSLEAFCLGTLTITSYRSVPEQTDDSPFYTSIGVHTNPYITAVSQDLLQRKVLSYGDLLYIEGIGFKFVADTMNKKHTNWVDIWVETPLEEHRTGLRKARVWVVKGNIFHEKGNTSKKVKKRNQGGIN